MVLEEAFREQSTINTVNLSSSYSYMFWSKELTRYVLVENNLLLSESAEIFKDANPTPHKPGLFSYWNPPLSLCRALLVRI